MKLKIPKVFSNVLRTLRYSDWVPATAIFSTILCALLVIYCIKADHPFGKKCELNKVIWPSAQVVKHIDQDGNIQSTEYYTATVIHGSWLRRHEIEITKEQYLQLKE